MGAKKPDEAKDWVATVIRLALTLTTPLSLFALVFPDLLLWPFIREPETLALARTPLRLIALTLPFDCFGMVYLNALQGVGDQKRVMLAVVGVQWLFFLPLSYLVGPKLGYGLNGIWAMHLIYRSVQAAILARIWADGRWSELKV